MNYEGEALNIQRGGDADRRKRYSVVYKDKVGNFDLVAREGTTIHRYFKGLYDVGSDDPNAQYYKEYIRLVIQAIIDTNSNYIKKTEDGHYNFELYIACPTSWKLEQKEQYQRFFDDALSDMGVRVSFVINESDAAYFTHRPTEINNCVLIIDYGSSTIDYTLIVDGRKVSDDTWSNRLLGAWNIVNNLKLHFCNQEKISAQIEKLRNQLIENGEFHVEEKLETLITYKLRKSIEESFTTGYYEANNGNMIPCFVEIISELADNDYDAICMKGNLHDIITPYIEEVKREFTKLKERVNEKLNGRCLNRIILSGGACKMSWVFDLLREVFGSDVDYRIDYNPSYVVAIGIAKYARAQKQALRDLLDQLENLPYGEMFKMADTDATNCVIIEEIPDAMQRIRNIEGILSGDRIREEVIAFMKRFTQLSPMQDQAFNRIINEKLKEQIIGVLTDVIKGVFQKELTEEDKQSITFNMQTDAFVLREDSFNPGGFWAPGGPGYKRVENMLDDVWCNDMGNFSFTMSKERTRDVFIQLVDGFERRFKQRVAAFTYNNEIAEKAEAIKRFTMFEAERLFYKLHLFETTFTM